MPTKEWFRDNPKVSAYISKDLHNQLEEWMNRKGIKKISQAVTTILEEHLNGARQSAGDDLRVEVAQLRAKVEQHEQFVFQVVRNGIAGMSAPETIEVLPDKKYNQLSIVAAAETNESKPTSAINESDEPTEWITMKEAFNAYGQGMKWNSFRKMTPQQFKERFGIEADQSRKTGKRGDAKTASRWLRKPPQVD